MKQKGISPNIKKKILQKADILKTHGNNKRVIKITKFKKFSNWKPCIESTIKWYSEFYKNKRKI